MSGMLYAAGKGFLYSSAGGVAYDDTALAARTTALEALAPGQFVQVSTGSAGPTATSFDVTGLNGTSRYKLVFFATSAAANADLSFKPNTTIVGKASGRRYSNASSSDVLDAFCTVANTFAADTIIRCDVEFDLTKRHGRSFWESRFAAGGNQGHNQGGHTTFAWDDATAITSLQILSSTASKMSSVTWTLYRYIY